MLLLFFVLINYFQFKKIISVTLCHPIFPMSAIQVWRSIWFSLSFSEEHVCQGRTLRNTEYQVANASSGSVWLSTLSKGALLRSLKTHFRQIWQRTCMLSGNLYTFFWLGAADEIVVADADYWHTGFKDVRDVSWVDMINERFWWRCDPGWGANSLREGKKREYVCPRFVGLLIDQYWTVTHYNNFFEF